MNTSNTLNLLVRLPNPPGSEDLMILPIKDIKAITTEGSRLAVVIIALKGGPEEVVKFERNFGTPETAREAACQLRSEINLLLHHA